MNPGASERRGGAGVFVTSDVVDAASRHASTHASSSFGVVEAYFTADGSGPCKDDARGLATCLRSEGYNQAYVLLRILHGELDAGSECARVLRMLDDATDAVSGMS